MAEIPNSLDLFGNSIHPAKSSKKKSSTKKEVVVIKNSSEIPMSERGLANFKEFMESDGRNNKTP